MLPREFPWKDAEATLAKLNLIDAHLVNFAKAQLELANAIKALGILPEAKGLLTGLPWPAPFPAPLQMPIDDGGIAASGTESSLTDTSKYWASNSLIGSAVWFVIDKQLYRSTIIANTLQEFDFSPSLPKAVMPDYGTPYFIKQTLTPSQLSIVYELFLTKAATQVINKPSLSPSATSLLADCQAIDLTVAKTALAVTVACTFDAAATAGIRVHVRSSYDGTHWDTQDFDSWIPNFSVGATIQATKVYDTSTGYLKVLIENMDVARSVTNISVQSLVRGVLP
jgi:hypothetical protein